MPATPAAGPLSGLRVIELSSFVASPLGGLTLAQLGADVIRIDPLGGAPDVHRWPLAASGTSMYWTGLNKAKRSIAIDFNHAEGQALIHRLITESGPDGGILLTNAIGRDWLKYEHLSAARADLIQIQVLGHYDGRSAVDYTVNAGLGFPLITGPQGSADPVNHVLPAWDISCGLHAAVGILAAERRRRLSGIGALVNVALYDVALAMAANLGLLAEAELNGVRREPIGNYLYGGFGRDFRTSDGHRVMLVTLTKRHWQDLLRITGLTAAFAEISSALSADFTTDGDRFRYREVIAGLIAPWFEARRLAEVEPILGETSLLWSTYRSFRQVVDELRPELVANPMMSLIEQPGLGSVLSAGSPLNFVGTERVAVRPASPVGADASDVLGELLALSEAEIRNLQERNVVGQNG